MAIHKKLSPTELMHEQWFARKVKILFGKRCPDYARGCGCCDAWYVYDAIIEQNRGLL